MLIPSPVTGAKALYVFFFPPAFPQRSKIKVVRKQISRIDPVSLSSLVANQNGLDFSYSIQSLISYKVIYALLRKANMTL